jgi:hypothetical protein
MLRHDSDIPTRVLGENIRILDLPVISVGVHR